MGAAELLLLVLLEVERLDDLRALTTLRGRMVVRRGERTAPRRAVVRADDLRATLCMVQMWGDGAGGVGRGNMGGGGESRQVDERERER